MNEIKRPQPDQDGLSRAAPPCDTLKSEMPSLAALFELLAAGLTPNFLELLAAISEYVSFYTEADSNCDDCQKWLINMSEKKCLFCD